MAAMKVTIVIVNWNSGLQLKACVDSIAQFGGEHVEKIIVVDNGSVDGSEMAVDEDPNVALIRTGENLGFGAACNIGAQAGNSPYILFLNPDTCLKAGSLSIPLDFMGRPENAKVGICGIQLVDEQGNVSRTCSRYPTLGRLVSSALGLDKLPGLEGSGMHMRDWDHKDTRQVDQVIGAFYLMRRDLFEHAGGFDERFFVYFEEVDVAWRCKLAGWSSWYLTEAQAFHAGGGTSRQVKGRRLFYSLRSRLLYAFKHFPLWQAWILVGVTNLLEPFTRSIWCLLCGDFAGIRHTWAAYSLLWRSMGHILRGGGRYNP
jgi:GT2 family glycosyltransferase